MSKTLKILSRPKGNAEEYGRWSVNPYKGCSHGCLYCYLKKGVWANGLGGNTAELKSGVVSQEHAYHLAMAEIIEFVMAVTKDRATVYWKQSFVDFFGDEPIHGMTAREFLRQWPHSVDKDWNIFKKNE